MLADELDYVLGARTGTSTSWRRWPQPPVLLPGKWAVRANAGGDQEALRAVGETASNGRAWAIEGTGSYGAGRARFLARRDETLLGIGRTPTAERRLRGKDDSLDAARTARAALAGESGLGGRSDSERDRTQVGRRHASAAHLLRGE
jgi:transposase